ncbi:MAG: GNAT family N-acetyltransferase [Eubacteriales bacterium]
MNFYINKRYGRKVLYLDFIKGSNKRKFLGLHRTICHRRQAVFVTSNAVSIAQSKVQPECIPLIVYDDDLMVGFIMYCIDEDDGEYWIYRMMIDKKYQSNGYGKKAMITLLDIIKKDKNHNKVFLGVHKESIFAVNLYNSFGFAFTGQVFGNEYIMRLDY